MLDVIEPVYPKLGNGRRPYLLETMLRIHCINNAQLRLRSPQSGSSVGTVQ